MNSLRLGINAGAPLTEAFSLYAKLGIAFWDSELSITGSNNFGFYTEKLDSSGNDLYFGFGGKFDLDEIFLIGAEYTKLDTEFEDKGESSDYNIGNLSAFTSYTF